MSRQENTRALHVMSIGFRLSFRRNFRENDLIIWTYDIWQTGGQTADAFVQTEEVCIVNNPSKSTFSYSSLTKRLEKYPPKG